MGNNVTAILVALIGAAGPIANGIVGHRLKEAGAKPRIWTPWRYHSKVANKAWWPLHIAVAIVLGGTAVFLFYPRWVTIDSCSYHLGDNIFRMDGPERPRFPEPGGENVDHLILWNKDTRKYASSSAYARYPDPEQWQDLHLEEYDEVMGGRYYLGNCVVGYMNTFSLRDLKANARCIIPPKELFLDFDVFHLSDSESGGSLVVILNCDSFRIRVIGKGRSNVYRWSGIEPIVIPLSLFELDLNSVFIFVTPKYTYHEGTKRFHFEDVEIRNLRVRLN